MQQIPAKTKQQTILKTSFKHLYFLTTSTIIASLKVNHIKTITELQLEVAFHTQKEENLYSFSAVPLISDSNISGVGSLLANIASGTAKGHLTFAIQLTTDSNAP